MSEPLHVELTRLRTENEQLHTGIAILRTTEADEIERLKAEIMALHKILTRWSDANKELEAEIEQLQALLGKLDWKSIDKDNMEYSCRIPYNVMDELRRALEPKP